MTSERQGEGTRGGRDRPPTYEPMDPVLVRIPLLPIGAVPRLLREVDAASGEALAEAVASLADGRVRAALMAASPDFVRALERPERSGREREKLRSKLVRYIIRMSTRPTPFGLFAGVAVATWGTATDLALSADPPRTRTRPDMAWLLQLVADLEARPEIRQHLSFYANPRAFVHAGRVFLPETATTASDVAGTAVSIRATNVVRHVLGVARRPTPYERLVEEVMAQPGADLDRAHSLLDELWTQTLLLSDLRPSLLDPDPARSLVECLAALPEAGEVRCRLQTLLDRAAAWDCRPWRQRSDGFDHVLSAGGGSEGSSPVVQVDMAWALTTNTISRAVGEEAARAVDVLLRISPSPRGPANLSAYRAAFEARYGSDREVALLELLDPNFGLGPPGRHAHALPPVDPARSAVRQQTLLKLAMDAGRHGELVVELDEPVIHRLETSPAGPVATPTSLDLAVLIAARSRDDIDTGRFQIVVGPNLGAAAAGRNLGRFADLLGCTADLERLARAEEKHAPDRLWAEVTYLPHRWRSANVVIRPIVREYEIAVGVVPKVDPEHAISVDELVVGLSEQGLYLRWPRADAEVIPCAGHMLNTMQAPDLCRFFDDVSRADAAQLNSFDWGPAWGLPFLPRIQLGRVVLSPAQWMIDADACASTLPVDDAEQFLAGLAAWRERQRVPRHVYLATGDNRLLLDLDEPEQASELRHELRGLSRTGQVRLQEALPGPEHAWVPGPDGLHAAELIVPLVQRDPPTRTSSVPSSRTGRSADRVRAPGSDWLFAKLYVPEYFEEDVVVGPMREFAETVRLAGLASGWYFVRYSDPEPHLRLRFQGQPDILLGDLLPQLAAWATGLIEAGQCKRFAFDTFERELERYGGPGGMEAAEALFCADSRAVVDLLAALAAGSVVVDLITLTVLSVDDLLASLGEGVAERLTWYRSGATSTPEIGAEYRRRQRELRQLLGDPTELPRRPGGQLVADALAARRETVADVARRLEQLDVSGKLSQPLPTLYRSFVHLHLNRMAARSRSVEPTALELLARVWHGLSKSGLVG